MGKREFQENIIELKGIGEKTGKLFNKLRVYTCGDLLYYFPRGYDLFEAPKRACDLKENVICACRLTVIGSVTRRIKEGHPDPSCLISRLKSDYCQVPDMTPCYRTDDCELTGTDHIFL